MKVIFEVGRQRMSPSKLVSVMLSKNSTKKKVEVIISTVAKKKMKKRRDVEMRFRGGR